MKYLNKPVAYLQDSDFDSEGNLINPDIPSDRPVVLMIQAVFCGYCTEAKKAFQEFAETYKDKVFTATIQGDGKEKGEKELSARVGKIKPGFRGYPDYVLFKGGKRQDVEIKGRGLEHLKAFAGV
jgi:thiol-disulfide isomerase/thioredoxin